MGWFWAQSHGIILEHENYLDVRTILNKMIPEHDQMELVLFDPVIQCNIMTYYAHECPPRINKPWLINTDGSPK